MNIVIRDYRESDYDFINSILNEAFDVNKAHTSSNLAHEYVCEYNNIIVGYFYLLDGIDIVLDKKYIYLEYLCVDSRYRGLGISNSIMEFILDFAKKNDVKFIELTSNSKRVVAHELYKKYGFEVRDTNVFRKEIL